MGYNLLKEVNRLIEEKRKLIPMLIILTCFLMLAMEPPSSVATDVFFDDFNDGNYDGWTPTDYGGGSIWSASEFHLRLDQTMIGSIARESSVSTGKWSLDIYCENPDMKAAAYFMVIGYPPNSDATTKYSGYAIQLATAPSDNGRIHTFSIRKRVVDSVQGIFRGTILDSYLGDEFDTRWYHIDVTRTSNGQITAFLNGTQILQAVDTDFDSSDYFALVGEGQQCFDNVRIDDTPLSGGLEIIVLGIGAGAILIVALVVIKRRR